MNLKIILLTIMLQTSTPPTLIFDFNNHSNIQNWVVVDDVVMGGRSTGNFSLDTNGFGVFSGAISLENNGGFSSVKYDFHKISVGKHTHVYIKLDKPNFSNPTFEEIRFLIANKKKEDFKLVIDTIELR